MIKKKLLALFLSFALLFSLVPTGSSYAAYEDDFGVLLSKMGGLSLNDLSGLLTTLGQITEENPANYRDEIQEGLNGLPQSSIDVLVGYGFLKESASGNYTYGITKYDGSAIENILGQISSIILNGYNGVKLVDIGKAAAVGYTELSKYKDAMRGMYESIYDQLPTDFKDKDLSNYGSTKSEKVEIFIQLLKDVYTSGDAFVGNFGSDVAFFVPEGYMDKANAALAVGSNPIQLNSAHILAMNMMLDVMSQKLNDSTIKVIVGDKTYSAAGFAIEIAKKLGIYGSVPEQPKTVTINKSTPTTVSFRGQDISLDFSGFEFDGAPSSVEVTIDSSDKAGGSNMAAAGPVLDFVLSPKPTGGTAKLGLKLNSGANTSKTSIYYYNTSTGAWEKQTSNIKDGVVTANVSHFSVYGVFEDTSTTPTTPTDPGTNTGGGGGGGGGGGAVTENPATTETPAAGTNTPGSFTNTVVVENKVAVDVVKVTETAAKVTVQVDAAKFTAEVAKAVENLAAAVEKAAANEEVVAKIVIPVAQTTKEEVQVNIPVAALAKAMDKNVEVVFEAKGVEVAIPVQNIKTGFENVSFEMKEVKETAELVQKINQKMAQSAAGAAEVTKVAKVFTFDLTGTNSAGQTERLDKSFDKKVKVTMDISDVAVNKDKAVLKYVDSDGNTNIVGKKIKDGKITAHLSHFSSYALMEREVKLTDIDSHWAKDAISSMASKDIVKGYEDLTFKPENKVTRAEFAKLLVEALELDMVKSQDTFKDTKGHWGADYIATAYKNGIISGYDKDTFKPNAQITRAEMAVMLSRALGNADAKADLGKFADGTSIPAWAQAGVKGAVASELMKGDANGKFNPQNQTTRAESATVIYRLFNK